MDGDTDGDQEGDSGNMTTHTRQEKGGDAMIYHPSEYQTTATRFIESHEQAMLFLEMGL